MRCIDSIVHAVLVATPLLLAACAGVTTGEHAGSAAESRGVEPSVSAEARQIYQQAVEALRSGQLPEAEQGFLAVARREPALAGPHANLGIVYERMGRGTQAAEALQRAIQLNPRRAAYHNELGMVLRRDGKFDEARRHYLQALEIDPNYAHAHLNLGILYDLYLRDSDKALQYYQSYQALAPGEAGTVAKWIVDLQQRQRAAEHVKGGKNG